ncbi:MAG: hypothetical protein ACHREM_11900 [Polyangiales bacterium]
MQIRPTFSALALLALVSAAGGACSSTPDANDPVCGGSGSQNYADMCKAITDAFTAKCPGTTFDCSTLVSGTACSDTSKVFCVDPTNAIVNAINSAASCSDVPAAVGGSQSVKCHS